MQHRSSERKYYGHTCCTWATFCVMIIITILVVVILALVLPGYAEKHSCTLNGLDILARMKDTKKSKTFDRLKTIADLFGARLSGSTALSDSIDWIVQEVHKDNITVWKEEVLVTKWEKGVESASIIHDGRQTSLRIEGLFGTVGGNITASLFVINEEAQMTEENVKGKVVVFNFPWNGYTESENFVLHGAVTASKFGAVGCLIRSATPFSLGTMHTGHVEYETGVTPIPAASITVEDASMLQTLTSLKSVSIHLFMDEHESVKVTSHNVIAELKGTKRPEEVLVLGTHLDSVDLGQGIQDNLAGFVISWEVLRILKAHYPLPQRTIRVVGFVGQENGMEGSKAYSHKHSNATVFAMDASQGVSAPTGLLATIYDQDGLQQLKDLSLILKEEGAATITEGRDEHADINPLLDAGVPGAVLTTTDGRDGFYWYFHSEADTVDKIDPQELANNAAVLATYAYCVADLDATFTRREL